MVNSVLFIWGDGLLDKIKKVNNPLTIIAIFAGLAEIVGTGVLLGLPVQIQGTFVWFVMIFPITLVIAFFITLNWNHRVLYAPSDYADQNHFIKLLEQKQKITEGLTNVSEIIVEAKEIADSIGNNSSESAESLVSVNNKLEQIKHKLAKAQDDNSSINVVEVMRSDFVIYCKRIEAIVSHHPGIDEKDLRKRTAIGAVVFNDCLNELVRTNRIFMVGVAYYSNDTSMSS
jgi:hypothetical protein